MELHADVVETHGACPLDCPDGCSWNVTVSNGTALKLTGKREHPFTAGALCVKVNHYLEQTRAPDRILHPLIRVGAKGAGVFREATWDEAIDLIGQKWTEILREYGGEAIWPYQGTGNLGYIQGLQGNAGRRLWNVLGTSRHHMSICSIAGQAALEACTGTSRGIDPESLAESGLIILWGVNTLTSGHHLWRSIDRARSNGAVVVAVDPIRTRTARSADIHIAPRPGTDAALILHLIWTLEQRGLVDAAYVEDMTSGWSDFRSNIELFDSEYTSQLTGVDAGQLSQLAELVCASGPVGIRAGMGLQRHAGGGNVIRLIACLSAALGDWGRYGGGVTYSTDGYFGLNREDLFRDDLLKQPVRTLSMTHLGETLLSRDLDPPVKSLFIYGANPVSSSPGQGAIVEGLHEEDLFTVVAEHFLTDTTDYADVVLPATMQTEHLDIHDGYGHMYISWNEPAVSPPGKCLSMTEMFRRIARSMHLDEQCLYDSDSQIATQLMDSDHPSLEGITAQTLRSDGWARLHYPEKFIPFGDGFPTNDGRFHFPTDFLFADAFSKETKVSTEYPFQLLATADHFRLNSTFANNPRLAKRSGAPVVSMHPLDARERAIRDGQPVELYNDRGSFSCQVLITKDVPLGVLAMTKGQWMKITGGATANATVDERDADFGGGAVFHDNAVDIRRLPRDTCNVDIGG